MFSYRRHGLSHTVVPLDPDHSWAAHKNFSKRFAEALSMAEPDRYVAAVSKTKRKGKIVINWRRNKRSANAILLFLARAQWAPIAVPIGWDALADVMGAGGWRTGTDQRSGGADPKGWEFCAADTAVTLTACECRQAIGASEVRPQSPARRWRRTI